jgi:hypothetical protein
MPFSSLTLADRRRLLQQWHRARGGPTIFAEAFAGVTKFQCQEWTKSELGSIYIIPHFKQWLPPAERSREFTFREWVETEPYGELSPHHPLRIQASASFTQEHPVIVGKFRSRTRLLDGYHRAVQFWRTINAAANLASYVPIRETE